MLYSRLQSHYENLAQQCRLGNVPYCLLECLHVASLYIPGLVTTNLPRYARDISSSGVGVVPFA